MRVLHFELTENIGGIETFILNLYKNIDRNKYKFDFIATCDNPAYGREFETLGGQIYRVPGYKNIVGYSRKITELIKRNDYDIIHIHKNSAANILPAIIAKQVSRAKIIVHAHNTLPTKGLFSKLLHKMNRDYLYKLSDVHLACSDIAGRWMFGNENFEVIPNGIDADRFKFSEEGRNKVRREFKIPEEAFVIGNIARFVEQKNHRLLISIFENLLQIQKNAYLILVGRGGLEEKIKSSVQEKGISDHVIFAGSRKDIPDVMSAMDVFLMPSLYEGLPIVAVEAQANGLPLVLSDTIAKETNILGDTTWIGLYEDTNDIAKKIVLCTDIKSLSDRHKKCDAFSECAYTIENTVRSVEKIYS